MKSIIEAAYEKAIMQNMNAKDCKECPMFSLVNKVATCAYTPLQDETITCALVDKELNRYP